MWPSVYTGGLNQGDSTLDKTDKEIQEETRFSLKGMLEFKSYIVLNLFHSGKFSTLPRMPVG